MKYLKLLDISHLKSINVGYHKLINDIIEYPYNKDFKKFPLSSNRARARRLKCNESTIRRMLKRLEEEHANYVNQLKQKGHFLDKYKYNECDVFGYNLNTLVKHLSNIKNNKIFNVYFCEEKKTILQLIIEDLEIHPNLKLDERIKRISLYKKVFITRFELWSLCYNLRFFNLRTNLQEL